MAGFPVHCIFRPCRRSIIELPRLSYPSVPPTRQLRVSPLPRSFGCASRRRFQVFPGPCIFRLYRQRIFELPRISRSSVPPVLELSVSLELRSSRLLLPTCAWVSPRASSSGLALGLSFRVAPASLSLGVGWWIPEFPRFSHPPAPPSLRLQVSLIPASTAGSMIGSRSSRTLHPRLSPRMNLRIQSGFAVSLP